MSVTTRSTTALAAAAVAVAAVVAVAVVTATGQWDGPPGPVRPSQAATSPPPGGTSPDLHQDPAEPTRPPLPDVSSRQVWASWAVHYLDTGHTQTGGENGTSTTASMIKVAIAADVLRSFDQHNPPRDPTAGEADALVGMIVDSDNDAAEQLYRQHGGDRLLQRVIRLCRLKETTTVPGWWSQTRITAADAARLAGCIARGEVASPGWVEWLLGRMREVRGQGRFGFVETVPTDRGRPLAIKNGWVLRGDTWHVSCLAIADWWTMAALARYPAELGLGYGARLCAQVAAAWHPVDDEDAPSPTWRGTGRFAETSLISGDGRGQADRSAGRGHRCAAGRPAAIPAAR